MAAPLSHPSSLTLVALSFGSRRGVRWDSGPASPTSPALRDPGLLEPDGTPEMTQPYSSFRKPGN